MNSTTVTATGFDSTVDSAVQPIADVFEAVVFYAVPIAGAEFPLIIVWLTVAAVFLTVYLRFQPLTGLKTSVGIIRGRFTRKTDPGQVSSFQALATELSGTVGLGNIAGVALGISVGGPGAALWIVLFGFLAMSMKMAEATLGVKYRVVHEDGTVSGGPMYVLRDGLKDIGRPKTGRVLAVFYAVVTVISTVGAAAMFQTNQAVAIFVDSTGGAEGFFGDKLWLVGLVMAILVGLVILGGISSIASFTSRLVPIMTILYFVSVIVIICSNLSAVPEAVAAVFRGAVTGEGVAGGAIGVAIIGIQRSLFSNAGGVGTAATAHSASKTTKPATEGFVAMWEPLIDSVVVCSLTSIAIIVSGVYTTAEANDGIVLTAAAFRSVSDWFAILLTVCAVLFAYSTLLSYSYYGQKALGYLTKDSPRAERVFQIVWMVAIVIGASVSFDAIMQLTDSSFFLMSIPNILGIYFLARVVRMEILSYRKRRALGIIREIEQEDLQVGMGDHTPTEKQIEAADAARKRHRAKLRRVRTEFRRARSARIIRKSDAAETRATGRPPADVDEIDELK